MKTLLRFVFVYLPVVLVLALGAFALFGTEREAAVASVRAPTAADAARARAVANRVVRQLLDARTETGLSVGERDIDGLFALMRRAVPRLAGDAAVTDGGLALAVTLRLPRNPFRNFVNFRFGLNSSPAGMDFADAGIGAIRLPGPVVAAMLRYGMDIALGDDTGRRLLRSVRSVRFQDGVAHLRIRPVPDLRARLVALSDRLKDVRDEAGLLGDRATIAVYYGKLAEQERVFAGRKNVSLAAYLAPLFAHVRDRSGFGDPVTENRAALMALAVYMGDLRFEKLTGPVRIGVLKGHRPRRGDVTLNGRYDLMLHFVVSMGLKLVSDQGIAMAIGEFKELLDSGRGGSGFSFADLGADRAGLAFAETATESASAARRVQAVLAGNPSESLFFPTFTDLPENMRDRDFRRRFGGVGDERYRAVVAEIDRRIGAAPAYAGD